MAEDWQKLYSETYRKMDEYRWKLEIAIKALYWYSKNLKGYVEGDDMCDTADKALEQINE